MPSPAGLPRNILLDAATTNFRAGRTDEAARLAQEALELSRRVGAPGIEAHVLCLTGDLAAASGAGNAEGHYLAGLALAHKLGMRPLVAHGHLGLGKVGGRLGPRERARQHLTTAAAMYREMDMRFWLDQATQAMVELG